MLSTVLLAVAHARLFTAPAPNAVSQVLTPNVASPQPYMSVDTVASPLVQPQMIVEVPAPQRSASTGTGVALGVALVAAGLGVVAGRQGMLFMGGRAKATPKKSANSAIRTEDRPRNRGGPYQSNKKNIQLQRNGFGTFVQKFQLASGKSKYGVPIFLPNGNVNPAYLAAERKELQAQSKLNTKAAEAKRKDLIKNKQFELADYIRKAIGEVGSGKEYYQSGR